VGGGCHGRVDELYIDVDIVLWDGEGVRKVVVVGSAREF
jgi:hypothetical protein